MPAAQPVLAPTALSAHRVLSALATGSVLFVSTGPWRVVVARSAALGTLYGAVFVLLLGALMAAMTATSMTTGTRLLLVADTATFAVALTDAAVGFRRAFAGHATYRVDESVLAHLAARAVARGADPYRGRFPAAVRHVPTLLLNGHEADRFGYPPLEPLLAAALAHLAPGVSETTTLGFLCLAATGVLVFVLLPGWLRPLAVLAVFTVSPLPFLAGAGYPMMVATPFLVVAVAGWHRVGAGGRLGRRGVVQVGCLGLAVSAQQYVWFVAPFLLVVLWRQRRGELERRPAARVTLRAASLVAGVFAVVNLPFAVADVRAWWTGVLDPLTQHGFFDGPGFVNVTLRVVQGSGGLQFYGYAALALYVALLLAVACRPQRLAPAAVVLPVLVFWVSMRSQAVYYQQILPVALVAVATTGPGELATARPLTCPPRVRVLLPVLASAVSAACLVVALAWPAPLRVRAVRPDRAADRLVVQLSNTSGSWIEPHFSTALGAKQSVFWAVRSGPARLGPHRSAAYVLDSPVPGSRLELRTRVLYVVSDDPQTLSVGRITVR